MLRVERLEKILEIVDEKGVVTVDELMDRLGASRSTIRRDLEQMDMGGKLKKTHGGAVRIDKPIVAELPLAVRQQMQTGEKARIGKCAADMVQNGDTIAICAGTTTFHMAAGLADKKDVTVLTNDIAIAAQIAALEGCRLIVAGGMLKDDSMTLVGMFTESMLSELHVETVFMSSDAVDPAVGFLDYNTDEILIKRTMLENSTRRVMLCDHKKFQNKAFMRICDLTDVDEIICGSELDEDMIGTVKEAVMEIHIV